MTTLFASLPIWFLWVLYFLQLGVFGYLCFDRKQKMFLRKCSIVGLFLATGMHIVLLLLKKNILPFFESGIMTFSMVLVYTTFAAVVGISSVEKEKKKTAIGLVVLLYALIIGMACFIIFTT